jgi:16S rRNA (cytidine1402-2'-O)-methyltransferase
LAATPIGNLGDASPRLCEALRCADVIAAEDTRKALNLIQGLGLQTTARIVSYFDAVENDRVPQLLAALEAGQTVVVISDAGMPTVSDPGYRIAHAAAAAGHAMTVLPGPSAVTTALALSGLASDRFSFEGFLSRKAGEREKQLQELASERRTMVFFEAPHRVAETTAAMAAAFGDQRPAALCREISKTYEEVIRGTIGEIAARCESEVRGEITLVIEGATAVAEASDADLVAAVNALTASGVDRKAAIAEVAVRYAVPKRRVFDVMVADKR